MKKEEFLKELEHRLHILNDNEKKDLIEEYAQHIDIKISNGLSEEAAVADFGNIKELADEILSAYSVNLKYNRPDMLGKSKNIMSKMIGKLLDELKKIGKGISLTIKKVMAGIKNGLAKCTHYLSRKKTTTDNIETTDEINRGKKKNFVFKLEKSEGVEKSKGFVRKTIIAIWNFTKKTFVLCLKAGIIFALMPFIGIGFMGLIALGFLVVMVFQGYPVIGFTIATLGGCIFTIVFILWIVDIFFCKKNSLKEVVEVKQ